MNLLISTVVFQQPNKSIKIGIDKHELVLNKLNWIKLFTSCCFFPFMNQIINHSYGTTKTDSFLSTRNPSKKKKIIFYPMWVSIRLFGRL